MPARVDKGGWIGPSPGPEPIYSTAASYPGLCLVSVCNNSASPPCFPGIYVL